MSGPLSATSLHLIQLHHILPAGTGAFLGSSCKSCVYCLQGCECSPLRTSAAVRRHCPGGS
jgi:hypothetical protein